MIESVPVCMGLDAEALAAKPSRSEVSQALNCLENGNFSTRIFEVGGDTVLECFTYLCGLIWDEEMVPKDWVRQVVVPIHKKGLETVV